ncbi:MAG TPA: ABC transporter permease subunit [Solirubrobacteraceae bacterium]|nr:ABC transporter permease subunit [Solirubrobacteraceae bacterium]
MTGPAQTPTGEIADAPAGPPRHAPEREALEASIIERHRARLRRQRNTYLGIRFLSLVIVLAAWQYYGSHSIGIIFQPITTVISSLWVMIKSGALANALGYSLWTLAIGYLAGLLCGVTVGMGIGVYRKVEAATGIYVYALYATPMVAIAPLLSIWFGFGVLTQLLLIGLFVFFPAVVTVSYGVRNIDPELLEVARSLRMGNRSMWRHVLLPGAAPYIAAGATQGVAMGLVGMFIAEIFTQLTGLGDLLETAAQTYHTANALAVLLVIMFLGVSLRGVLTLIQRRIAPWAR